MSVCAWKYMQRGEIVQLAGMWAGFFSVRASESCVVLGRKSPHSVLLAFSFSSFPPIPFTSLPPPTFCYFAYCSRFSFDRFHTHHLPLPLNSLLTRAKDQRSVVFVDTS